LNEEKFQNSEFSTVNPDFEMDSATAVIYLWKKDVNNPYEFSTFSENVWKVIESKEGVFVTPLVEPSLTLNVNSLSVTADPQLYPDAKNLSTGESVVVEMDIKVPYNVQANVLKI
jgi:hypothetical protein